MRSCLQAIPDDCKRLFVAYSGGLDSSVLLHLLLSAAPDYPLIAWHVNHGLVENALQMEKFCIDQAEAYGIELRIDRLDLGAVESNIEAEARTRRYRLFEQQARGGDVIVTAHHADDQAETFLLNALRGSGVAGLRGIARRRPLGPALLLRPLLDYSRDQLENYARENEIAWFNDPSNQNLRFDRNYLRSQVMPSIKKRWPDCHKTLAASSAIQAETRELLDEIASLDLAALEVPAINGDSRLDLAGLRALSTPRQKNLVRYWIESTGHSALPQGRLQQLIMQLEARADAVPKVAMPDYSIRIYDQRLFLVTAGKKRPGRTEYEFGIEPRIEIDELGISLSRGEIFERLQIEDRQQSLVLRFRQAGQANEDGHRLKRLFQYHRVPPWERESTAQVYLDGRLEGLLL